MFLLEAVSEAMSLNGVGSATGVDAGATLGFGVVDLSGLKPNLACNKRVARVTVSAVIASCVEDTTEVWSPSDDKSSWCQWRDRGCLQDTLCSSLHLK